MQRQRCVRQWRRCGLGAVFAAGLCGGAWAEPPVHHALEVRIDPNQGSLEVSDRITLARSGDYRFTLNAALAPRAAGVIIEPAGAGPAGPGLRSYRVVLPPGVHDFVLSYRGRPDPQPADRPHRAPVADDYVLLEPATGWYADFADRPVQFTMQVQLPQGWYAVSQGQTDWQPTTPSQRWTVATPQQGIWLVAGRFLRYRRATPWGEAQVFLRSDDPTLAGVYLDATATYLQFYSRLLGSYPYPKFALVENVEQTGFGMPSFTLLGSQVIRLPFIPHTSFPHEILHNWWGNGVWVDYTQGNWAEALTTYLADYLLAEQQARGTEYRRAALQKYADFVSAHSDFPLQAFQARHGEATQAIGYSKGMMVVHMLRRELGDRTFLQGLRAFFEQFRFRQASLQDLARVWTQLRGRDLTAELGQWLQRSGAPVLGLGKVEVSATAHGYRLRGVLEQRQEGAPYALAVPVAVQLAGGEKAVVRNVTMHERRQHFAFDFQRRPLRLAVDPAFDLFRRLDPQELPPSLGQLQGAPRAVYVLPGAASAAMREAYLQLARAWARPGDRIVTDTALAELPGAAVWLLGAENRCLARLAPDDRQFRRSGARLQLAGHALRLDLHSIAVALPGSAAGRAWVSAATPAAAAALARKLPHYSRYSYLAFAGPDTHNTLKGEWPVEHSPLERALTADAPALDLPQRRPLAAPLEPAEAHQSGPQGG